MTAQLWIGIFLGIAAVLFGIWLFSDFVVSVYNRGYDHGKRDAADWWTQAAKDVEEMTQEIRTEEQP